MEKEFGKIKKNAMTDIVIRIDDFGGKPGLTIREFATSEKYTGFTKSGTRISAENFKEFKHVINSIDEKDFGEIIKPLEPPKEAEEDLEKELGLEEGKASSLSEDNEEQPQKKSKKKKIQEELF